jgi:soluble lytic murein transglycosylase-like protein/TolA-binding protein
MRRMNEQVKRSQYRYGYMPPEAKAHLAAKLPSALKALKKAVLLVAVVVLSAACNLSEQPAVVYITATPEAVTDAPPPPPSETPAPTIPPTPTISPEVALAQANSYLTDGHYENAVAAYQTVLASGADANISASASFGLGQAALREGLFTDAVNTLSEFINRYPQDARIAQVYFLRGDAYSGLAQWAAALVDYQQYLALRPGMIDSYVHERIGDAQLALGQRDAALTSYGTAAEAGRSLVPELILREKVAQVYLNGGQTGNALAQYDSILAVARNAPYRASIEYAAAQAVLESGDTENGLARMLAIFETYPAQPEAYHAMQALLAAGEEVDDLARGQVSYNFGDYEDAIEAFNTFSSTHVLTEISPDFYLMLGRAYREIGNPTAAVTAFQTIVSQYPTDALFGQALLEQGRTKFLSNDIDGAIEQYLRIGDDYGYLPEAAEALWRVGYLYGTNDNPTQSRAVFERLADAYPDTEQAKSGLFLAASAAYNLGDKIGAERLYARLATTTTAEDQAAAYLWVGRLAMDRGDQQTANAALGLAVSAAPDTYFSARAQDILGGRDSFARPVTHQFEFDEGAEQTEAENWLRQTVGITQEGALSPLSQPLQTDTRLIRGNELWAVGAFSEAEVEFNDVIAANQTDALLSYQLAIFLRGIGAYSPAIQAGANVIRAANVATLDAPSYLARMRYPAYYLDAVLDSAQRHDVDPLLVFSLIRHESLFDTYATAGAGEKGLTQVIPVTGEHIAQQLNWPNYQHSDLFRPYVGIEFGTYFVAENLERFEGNVQAALAGYNAGPSRAIQWTALSGGDPDQFMTAITIDSTRTYVERIYGYYSIYRALYGGGS